MKKRYIRNYSIWADYVNRFMKNATCLNLIIKSSVRTIAKWEGERGYILENRSQKRLWKILVTRTMASNRNCDYLVNLKLCNSRG